MHDPTDVAETAEALAQQQERLRRQGDLERSCVKRIASSTLGRELLMRILERAGIFHLSFDASRSEDTHLHAFRDGRKSEGLWLYTLVMTACPEQWPTMVEENELRKQNEES